MNRTFLTLSLALALSACGRSADQANNAVITNVTANNVHMTSIPEDSDAVALDKGGADTSATDAWAGRWNGPEGLFLDIGQIETPGFYRLTIKNNLDSQASFTGTAKGATIRFTRDGKTETIHAGTGKETGIKWLADKKDCLIIAPGKEGYCR